MTVRLANPKNNFMQRSKRPTAAKPLSLYVVSGESVTRDDIAARLGITTTQVETRKRYALLKLKEGESLTWEMLTR